MNCKTCGSEARPFYNEWRGKKYIMMFYCDECDEEVFPKDKSAADISRDIDIKHLKKDMLGEKDESN